MIAILFSVLLTFTAHGEETLDFKDQVIEGDTGDSNGMRKASPLFGSGDDFSFDTIILKRSNFNDFHDLQKQQHLNVQAGTAK